MHLLEVILHSIFAPPTEFSFVGLASVASDNLGSDDGLVIGAGRRKTRFVRYPDGEFRGVDLDFDRSVLDDPDSISDAEQRTIQATILDVPSEILVSESVRTIAESMLSACPRSLVAVAYDSKGGLLGATITVTHRGLTQATFQASLRSLPASAKQVTFATDQSVPTDTQKTVSEIADAARVRVIDFLIID